MQGTYLRDEISKAGRGEWYAKKVLTALKMHGELQGICLGAEGDPLGIHGGSAPKSGDPAISRLLAHEF